MLKSKMVGGARAPRGPQQLWRKAPGQGIGAGGEHCQPSLSSLSVGNIWLPISGFLEVEATFLK